MNKLLLLLASFLLLCTAPALAQERPPVVKDGLTWYVDILQAQAISDSTGKPIFAFFTGSDWCGWCHKLQREVFAKPAFKDWAKKNMILLELDYPRNKQLDPAQAQHNAELQQVFRVTGYPTIWIFHLKRDEANQKMNIMPLGSLGYPSGAIPGQEEVKFIANANALLNAAQQATKP
jgi:protein disulfide-isomerase